jgi:hypothetical protein
MSSAPRAEAAPPWTLAAAGDIMLEHAPAENPIYDASGESRPADAAAAARILARLQAMCHAMGTTLTIDDNIGLMAIQIA